MQNKALQDKVAVVTGGNQGLGKEIARAYFEAGAKVAIIARDRTLLQQAAQEIAGGKTERLMACPGDVTDESAMGAIFAQITKAFGPINILVNNAGVYGPKGPIEEIDLGEWRRAMDINVMGTLVPTRLVLPAFKKAKHGKIINLSGGGATNPMPLITAYASSKAAVVRLTESLALEVKEHGIDVNAVAPGALNTRLLDEVLEAGPAMVGEQFYKRSLEQKKNGGASLANAANLCVYLASDASDGVTGRLISAVWDDWQTLANRRAEIAGSDIYTLRRITAKDRGQPWDEK